MAGQTEDRLVRVRGQRDLCGVRVPGCVKSASLMTVVNATSTKFGKPNCAKSATPVTVVSATSTELEKPDCVKNTSPVTVVSTTSTEFAKPDCRIQRSRARLPEAGGDPRLDRSRETSGRTDAERPELGGGGVKAPEACPSAASSRAFRDKRSRRPGPGTLQEERRHGRARTLP